MPLYNPCHECDSSSCPEDEDVGGTCLYAERHRAQLIRPLERWEAKILDHDALERKFEDARLDALAEQYGEALSTSR